MWVDFLEGKNNLGLNHFSANSADTLVKELVILLRKEGMRSLSTAFFNDCVE